LKKQNKSNKIQQHINPEKAVGFMYDYKVDLINEKKDSKYY